MISLLRSEKYLNCYRLPHLLVHWVTSTWLALGTNLLLKSQFDKSLCISLSGLTSVRSMESLTNCPTVKLASCLKTTAHWSIQTMVTPLLRATTKPGFRNHLRSWKRKLRSTQGSHATFSKTRKSLLSRRLKTLCMCSDFKDLNLLRFSGSILAIFRFCFKTVQNCFCSRSLNKFATSLPTCNKSHRRCCRWQRLPKWNTKTLQHL